MAKERSLLFQEQNACALGALSGVTTEVKSGLGKWEGSMRIFHLP